MKLLELQEYTTGDDLLESQRVDMQENIFPDFYARVVRTESGRYLALRRYLLLPLVEEREGLIFTNVLFDQHQDYND